MEGNFSFEEFIDFDIKDINFKRKVSKKDMLNLSSNELIHPRLTILNKTLQENISINRVNKYPFYPDELLCISRLLNQKPSTVSLYSGSDDAIKIILSTLGKKCRNLVIQTPNYENYYSYSHLYGIHVKEWNLNEDYEFCIKEGEGILQESKPSLVVITAPNGFTGKSMQIEDIRFLSRLCYEKSHVLILDCAYIDFDDLNPYDLIDQYNNVIIVKTLSKSQGIAGARFAYVLACESITKYLSCYNGINAISSTTYDVAKFYLKRNEELTQIRQDIIMSRNDFSQFIVEKMGWRVIESKSNFILIEITTNHKVSSLEEYLLENKIATRNLSHLKQFKNCIRLTIAEASIMMEVKKKLLLFIKQNEKTYTKR